MKKILSLMLISIFGILMFSRMSVAMPPSPPPSLVIQETTELPRDGQIRDIHYDEAIQKHFLAIIAAQLSAGKIAGFRQTNGRKIAEKKEDGTLIMRRSTCVEYWSSRDLTEGLNELKKMQSDTLTIKTGKSPECSEGQTRPIFKDQNGRVID